MNATAEDKGKIFKTVSTDITIIRSILQFRFHSAIVPNRLIPYAKLVKYTTKELVYCRCRLPQTKLVIYTKRAWFNLDTHY